MRTRLIAIAGVVAVVAAGCSGKAGGADSGKIEVVASGAPITDIVRNVAGNAADVQSLIPEGVCPRASEPTADTARLIADADVIFLNGLDLEDPTLALAQSDKKDAPEIFLLGEHTLQPDGYLYDFSFPRSAGHPNPHLWMDVAYAIRYTELVRDELSRVDPGNAATYRANAEAYLKTLRTLNDAVQKAVDTIPPQDRLLLTYHDSFPYFAHHYGM